MTAKEFYNEVVLKKVLVKENPLENTAHMMYGLNSEILDELQTAIENEDFENLKEELGDAEFFILGLMYFRNIEVFETEELIEKLNLPIFQTDFFDIDEWLLENFMQTIGILNSIFKKELVSGVLKYEGTIVTKEILANYIYTIQVCIGLFAETSNLEMTEIRQKIANKLNVRYKDSYTPEEDLNRNVQAEFS